MKRAFFHSWLTPLGLVALTFLSGCGGGSIIDPFAIAAIKDTSFAVSIAESSPAASPDVTLEFSNLPEKIDSYCFLENDTDSSNCNWLTGDPATTYQFSSDDGSKRLSVWVNSKGSTSKLIRTDTFIVDTTSPTWANSLANAASIISLTISPDVTFTANGDDGVDGSGIKHYEYSVGTTSGATDLKTWTVISSGASPTLPFHATGLSLTHGTVYYLNVRAVDKILLTSPVRTTSWTANAPSPTISYVGATGTTGTRGVAMSISPTTLNAGTTAESTTATVTSCTTPTPLPTGVTLNTSTCVFSGTPTTLIDSTAYTVTITNSYGRTATANVTLEVGEQWTDNSNATIGWGAGTHDSTSFSTNVIRLANTGTCNGTTDCSELDSTWTPEWASLEGYWKMNEASWNGTASEVLDATGNGHHGQSQLATTTTDAKKGSHAGIFGSGTEYITIPDHADLVTATFTFSTWVKFNSMGTYQVLGGKCQIFGGGVSNGGWFLRVRDSSYLNAAITTGGLAREVGGTRQLQADEWYYTTLTFDGTNAKIYLNGDLERSAVVPGGAYVPMSAGEPMVLGGNGNCFDWQNLNGLLDDSAYWSTALTQEQVQTIYTRQLAKHAGIFTSRIFDARSSVTATGLSWLTTLPFGKELTGDAVTPAGIGAEDSEIATDYSSIATDTLMNNLEGLWHLDESAVATTISDSSGHGNDGSLLGDYHAGVEGKLANSVSFDGASGFATLGNPPNFPDGLNPRTMCVWAMPSTVGAGYAWAFAYGSPALGQAMFIGRTGATLDVGGYAASDILVPNVWEAYKWTHICSSYDGSKAYVYVNGQLNNAGGTTLTWNLTRSRTYIGRQVNDGEYWAGKVDEVALWSRKLSDAEVLQLYRRGANRLKIQTRACATATCTEDPRWFGPYGDPLVDNAPVSYFTELMNNSVLDTFGLPLGFALPTPPDIDHSTYTGAPVKPSGRYHQYRVIMESDDTGSSCNYGAGGLAATWCSPELKSVTLKP